MDFLFQIIIILFLLLLNGYFVASEFAIVSVRKTRVDELVKKGNITAKILQKALKDLNTYISATQLGITIVSLTLGWIGEPAVAKFLEPYFSFLPHDLSFFTSHTLAIIIALNIITFLHIVIGELAPKSIALQKSEKTSLLIITPLVVFARIFQPFIWILNKSGQILLKIFGISVPFENQASYSEEEIKLILSQSTKKGVIPEKEAQMVYNVFQFGDIPVKLIMVPRTDILAFNITTPLKEITKQIEHHPHSRFPVYEGNIDNIIGFIHVKDVYRELLKNREKVRLSQIKITRQIINVPETKKIDLSLQEMRKKRTHMIVVNDEFGGTAGIVTLEDIIESLVGEIEDEFDQPIKNITKQKDGSFLLDGHTLIEDIKYKFHLSLKGQGYTTIGGLVFGLLGHEPKVGDTVQISGLMLQVEQMHGKRIKTLRLKTDKT